MKILLLTLLAVLSLYCSVTAQPRRSQSCGKVTYAKQGTVQPTLSKLCGRVTDGKKPIANLQLIPANEDPVITNDDGSFVIEFKKIGPGQPTAIRAGGNWAISNPFGGRFSTQSLDNQAEPTVFVLPKQAKEFLDSDHMRQLGNDILQKLEAQVLDLTGQTKTLRRDKKILSGELEDANKQISKLQFELAKAQASAAYSEETGVSLGAIDAALQRWANTPYKDYSDRDQAVQAAISGDASRAAMLANESMHKLLNNRTGLSNIRTGILEVEIKFVREAFYSAQIAGTQFRLNGELQKALATYTEIDAVISEYPNFKTIFYVEWSTLRILLATTKGDLADDASPPERARLSKEVIEHCKEAITIEKPNSIEWGLAELLWSLTLVKSAQNVRDDEQKKTLDEALEHMDLALKIDIHQPTNLNCENLCGPFLKATSGLIATLTGLMLGGEKGVELAAKGKSALTEALDGFGKEPASPVPGLFKLFIASAHYTLATELTIQEADPHLKTARTLIEQVLAGDDKGVPEKNRDFAKALLATVFFELAKHTSGKETIDYTSLAIAQFELLRTNCKSTAWNACNSPETGIESAITYLIQKGEITEAKPRLNDFISKLENQLESLPADHPTGRRLTTQISLGRSLVNLGDLTTDGNESERKLSAGVQTLENALLSIPESDAEQRTRLQLNIVQAQLALGRRVGRDKVIAGVKSTLANVTSLLSNPDKWELKTIWVLNKLWLGSQLEVLAQEFGEDERRATLNLAINHTEDALKFTPSGTTDWADANRRLGHQLVAQTLLMNGDEAKPLQERATKAFEAALTVFKIETFPAEWMETRLALADITLRTGLQLVGEEGIRKRQIAIDLLTQTVAQLNREKNPWEWATAQASLWKSLLLSAGQIAPPERIAKLSGAANAFKQAFTIVNPESPGRIWAQAQADYARVLFSVADANAQMGGGAEVKEQFKEAIRTFESVLKVVPPKTTVNERASTQFSLGVTLSRFGMWLHGEEGLSRLTEAVAVLNDAILVFSPRTQNSADAQFELGFAHFLIAQNLYGEKRRLSLNAAIAAYQEALAFYSTKPGSIAWANTNGRLADALLAAGWTTSGNDRVEKWTKAVELFNASIESFKRFNALPSVAQAHVGLGHTLIALALMPGAKRDDNLKAAIQAFRQTQSISESLAIAQGFKDANNGMGNAFLYLKQPTAAISCFRDVLERDEREVMAISGLAAVNHELLFNFLEAVRLREQSVNANPDNPGELSSLAEAYFTAARFAQARELLTKLLARPDLDASTSTALGAIEIANSLALGQRAQIRQRLDVMIDQLTKQPVDFTLDWDFDGTLHFLARSPSLSAHRTWLLRLFKGLKNDNRDSILATLTKAKTTLRRNVVIAPQTQCPITH